MVDHLSNIICAYKLLSYILTLVNSERVFILAIICHTVRFHATVMVCASYHLYHCYCFLQRYV